MVLGVDKALNQNENMKTDLLHQQIEDTELRELLKKSRTRNSVSPVHYKGKTYWYLDELTEEQNKTAQRSAFYLLLRWFAIGSFFVLGAMYVLASIIIEAHMPPN